MESTMHQPFATADFGIAMGAAGSDTAIETADIALMKDDLNGIATAIKVSRRVLNVIKFNVGFALAVKLAFLIPWASPGYTACGWPFWGYRGDSAWWSPMR